MPKVLLLFLNINFNVFYRIVAVCSGGNVDTTVLRRCLDRGLAAEGRLVKLKVTLPERIGVVTELCQKINSIGVAIKDLYHERAWIFADVFSVEVWNVV